jgi:hypothetical protein
MGGVNEVGLTAWKLGQAVPPGFGSCGPASVVAAESSLDMGRLASAAAGRTATYKLRARLILTKYCFISIIYGQDAETLKLASLPIRGQAAQKIADPT